MRPTQLRYREIYDLEACAEFVAGFLEFEPLAEPLKIPAILPSPSMIIAQQVSDSFGFAMVLASLLLGAGFDAYVVCGYAPRWITMRDQTDVLCPVIEKERVRRSAIEKESSSSKSAGGSDTATTGAGGTGTAGSHYDIKPHGVPNSSFIEMLESRKREAEEARKRWLKAQGDADPDVGRPDPESKTDPHWGKRVHAWVMVAPPKRKVKDFMFVEPTTGEVYSHDDSPYLGIESMWNHQNYWVNMQPMDQPMSKVSFDLGNAENWEYVFIDTTKRAAEKRAAEASREGDGAAAGVMTALVLKVLANFHLAEAHPAMALALEAILTRPEPVLGEGQAENRAMMSWMTTRLGSRYSTCRPRG